MRILYLLHNGNEIVEILNVVRQTTNHALVILGQSDATQTRDYYNVPYVSSPQLISVTDTKMEHISGQCAIINYLSRR